MADYRRSSADYARGKAEDIPLLTSGDNDAENGKYAVPMRPGGARTYSGMRVSMKADPGYETVPPYDDGENSAWFHGSISGEEADNRLDSNGMVDGLFLVRKRGNEHVLSVCNNGKAYHYLIKNKNGRLSLGREHPRFKDLSSLVMHFQVPRDPGLGSLLITPCSQRSESVMSTGSTIGEKDFVSAAERREKKRRRKERKERLIKEQLANLPMFTPYFTKGTAFIMGIIMVIQLAKSYNPKQPITKISFSPVKETGNPPVGLSKNRTQTFEKIVPTNFLIGPSAQDLIMYGAKYAPCMRKDTKIFAALARQREYEQNNLGCCTVEFSQKAQTTQEECLANSGEWVAGQRCSSSSSVEFRLRPCCLDNNGTCELTTSEYCEFFDGVWATDQQLCSETSCLAKRCGFSMKKNEPDQWYRFFIPIFLHGGLLHFAGCMALQLTIGVQIERAAGWLRMALIYFISGVGGYVASAVFSPDIPSVGCSGSLYGLLGVSIVDLVQNWQIVENPWWKLIKTIVQAAVLLLVGTIPFIDNWAHVGGFVFGVLAGIIFLPYLTFGAWDSLRKRLFLCICIPVTLSLFFVLLLIFYEIQGTEFCPSCKYIQCINYQEDFCKDTPGWTD
eukprot:m.24283 g.24283  ORF g.24283 m.24283 type:complete len:617 (+) comp7591_c0_seq4:17-1867(+)